MSLIKQQIKKRSFRKRKIKQKLISRIGSAKDVIYLVYYDLQMFSLETMMPIMTFKHLRDAEIYIANKNYEFQTLMLAARNMQQSYVLDKLRESFDNTYFVTVSDLILAGQYFTSEYNKQIKNITDESKLENIFWELLEKNIKPFRVSLMSYVSKSYD